MVNGESERGSKDLSETASEVPDQPYSISPSGMLECRWPSCTSTFTPDTPGLKAFAAHWAAHKKQGVKTEVQAKGLSAEELSALMRVKERYEEESREAVLKTCDQILAERDRIFEVYVPAFGCKIKYGRMLVHEFIGIKDLEEEEYLREALYLMWSKGDSTVTREKLEKYHIEEIRQIFYYIVENTPFLFQTRSATGESSGTRKSEGSP